MGAILPFAKCVLVGFEGRDGCCLGSALIFSLSLSCLSTGLGGLLILSIDLVTEQVRRGCVSRKWHVCCGLEYRGEDCNCMCPQSACVPPKKCCFTKVRRMARHAVRAGMGASKSL